MAWGSVTTRAPSIKDRPIQRWRLRGGVLEAALRAIQQRVSLNGPWRDTFR